MLSRLAAAVAELQEQEQQEERDSNDNPALRLEQLPEDVLLAICKFLPRYQIWAYCCICWEIRRNQYQSSTGTVANGG